MTPTMTEELERPAEWIRTILEAGAYRALLDETASLGVAAYRVARALCRIRPTPTAIPTLHELCAAARIIGEACGLPVPPASALLDACDVAGLVVIEPLAKTPAPLRVAYA